MDYRVTLSQITRTTLLAIGAKDYVYSDSDLCFTVSGNGRRGLQKIRITLVNDLYTVEYFAYDKHYSVKRHVTREGIFNAQLDSVVWDLAK